MPEPRPRSYPCYPTYAAVPDELKDRNAWVVWRLTALLDGKLTKVPWTVTGRKASSTDPDTWTSFGRAVDYAHAHRSTVSGIGYVLSLDDPYTGWDLDHAVENKEIAPWAQSIIYRLFTYTELSPSGTGIRMFVRGKLPPGGRKRGPIETYEYARYLTITGEALSGTPLWIAERTAEMRELHREIFGDPTPPPTPQAVTSRQRVTLTWGDNELLEKAMSAANGEKIRALWQGSWAGYPSQSEGDIALCSHLLFWTGGDAQRAGLLFRQSALMRDQWDIQHAADGRTYGQMTLDKALAGRTEFYDPSTLTVGAGPDGPGFLARTDGQPDDLDEFFR